MEEYVLFEKTQVGKINDSKPARLTIKEFKDDPAHGRLWVTQVRGGTKPNYQLMYSLGDDVFLNTFSERMSVWELTGLHILQNCAGEVQDGEPSFLTFYKKHNIKTTKVVNTSFAGITLKGYLIDMRIEDYNQEGVEGFKFTLKYLAMMKNLVDAANVPSKAGAGAEEATPSGDGSSLQDSENSIVNPSPDAPPVKSSKLPPPTTLSI